MPLNRFAGDILKSLRGERLGLDVDNRLVGHTGVREPQETLTAASTMERMGTSVLTGSTATFTLPAPLRLGVYKEIFNASTISTAAMAIVRSTAQGACGFLPNTSGTTAGGGVDDVKRINLINVGANITLRSISSSIWAVVARPGSSLFYTISTSS